MTDNARAGVLGCDVPGHPQNYAHRCDGTGLDVHDAVHAYLDVNDPAVLACLWCQS